MKKEYFKSLIISGQEKSRKDLKKRDLVLPDINKTFCIYGPRRSGKTSYLLYEMAQKAKTVGSDRVVYINFEDEILLPLEASDLKYITGAYYELYPQNKDKTVYLFLDEIQEIKGWERFIRRITDTENIRVYITGSSASLLSSEIATSLRGRTLSYEMLPLSFNEYLNFTGIDHKNIYNSKNQSYIINALNKYLHSSGYPETIKEDDQVRKKLLTEYMNLTIYRDVIERFNINNQLLAKYLLRHCFRNPASLMSVNKVYNDFKSVGLSLSKNSLYEYLAYLEDAMCVFFVPVYRQSVREQQLNPRKLYISDQGFYHIQTLKADEGRLFENAVYLELRQHFDHLFYYKEKYEVDFVAEKRDKIFLYNVCYDISDKKTFIRETRSLEEAMCNLGVKTATLITSSDEDELKTVSGKINIVPLWKWLLSDHHSETGNLLKLEIY